MLNRYGSERALEVFDLYGRPCAHPDEVGEAEGGEKNCGGGIRHVPNERGGCVCR